MAGTQFDHPRVNHGADLYDSPDCPIGGVAFDWHGKMRTETRKEYADHQKTIVHRDLKPANVLVTKDGVS